MVRVKRGLMAHKRRKHVLSYTKGYRWGRKKKYALAKEALIQAWQHAFRDRKAKKREFRQLWQIQINAAIRPAGISYHRFIHGLKNSAIGLDRKILSQFAREYPEIFKKVVERAKAAQSDGTLF